MKEQQFFEGQEALMDAQLEMMSSPWFREFLIHDPAAVLQTMRCPLLAVNGAKDVQVDPAQNLPAITTALAVSRHENFLVRQFPNLNHLFQTCTTGSVAEYGQIEETIAPDALGQIGEWIVQQTR